MFLENELSLTLPFDGEWDFKLGDSAWQSLPVPSAWEAHVADKVTDGPALYRRTFIVPESWLSSAVIVLEADAISFDATLRVNGQTAGHHQGMWSPFQIDIKPFVQAGENIFEIEVWKPGGRFPLRETLSGFLPDLATSFGGLWQGLRVRVFSWAAFDDIRIFAYGGGWLDIQGKTVGLGERRKYDVVVEVLDATEQIVGQARANMLDDHSFAAHLETNRIRNWTPQTDATLYSVRLSLRAREADIARLTRRVGFRELAVTDGKVLLDSVPLQLRGVLSWGWQPNRVAPTLTVLEATETFEKARSLGFNCFKLCLFVPDEATFNAADEAGMLLWLEMPLWLPKVTPALRELALREYRDLFQRLHHHPSIAILSLGCELNAEADTGFLEELHTLAREFFPSALHCDNSGSAEAYGGVSTSLSDFYDYHFYTDPHFFQPLVQHFDRNYRPVRPWLYGEFCDADTFRDFSLLQPEPWWIKESMALTRDDFTATRDYTQRLSSAGVTDSGAALTNAARYQATEIRKFIIEQVRLKDATGGYVVTGWSDTPITTSGMVDDQGALKFSGEEWRHFNADRVLLLDRERRRKWVGGDRPLYKDPFTWRSGETAELHLILSNGGPAIEGARLHWRIMSFNSPDAAKGDQLVTLGGGEVGELVSFTAHLPIVARFTELRLIATLTDEANSQVISQNIWKLWVVPNLHIPARLAVDLTPDLLERVRQGESETVWLRTPDSRLTHNLPFWREAIHVFNEHSLWDAVPQPGFADMRFFSVATDFALDPAKLASVLGPEAVIKPIWRRFDARQMFWTDYLVEVQLGAGRLRISTLRFAGGLGVQPDTLDTNPMGLWLLENLR
jgi:Glycosyl hydrolases family 2, sugar binding domain